MSQGTDVNTDTNATANPMNELLSYDELDLFEAAFRRLIILRLTAKRGYVDQDKIDAVSKEAASIILVNANKMLDGMEEQHESSR